MVVSLITQPIVLRALGETVEPFGIISAAIGGLFLFALYTVFQIPGYYKFGSIKGRVFMYIPVAGFLVTLFFLPKLPADNPIINAIASFTCVASHSCDCAGGCYVCCVDLVLCPNYEK